MKKIFFVLVQIFLTFLVFSFEPLYYSNETHKISNNRNDESDLYVIDTLELEDGEDIEDCVKIYNKTSTEIQKISVYAVGEYLLTDEVFDFWSWNGKKQKIVGQQQIDGLMFLGVIINIKPNSIKEWNSKLKDGSLRAFHYIAIEVNKPEDFQFKILDAKEKTDDLFIVIGK